MNRKITFLQLLFICIFSFSGMIAYGQSATWGQVGEMTTSTSEINARLAYVPPTPQTLSVTITETPSCGSSILTATAPSGNYDVDEENNNTCMADFSQTDLAQSFIPGQSTICGAGCYITSAGSGTVTIQLYTNLPTMGGVLLATGSVAGTFPAWADVSWASTPVTIGTTYYLVFTCTNGGLCIGGSTANPYPNGEVYANAGYGGFPSFDYTFRTMSCTVGGPTSYAWSTGDTTQSITVTTSAVYSCTVTVGLNSGSNSYNVNIWTPPLITPAQTNVTCNGSTNGTATVNATGNGPFTYSWSPSGGSNATASNLAPGSYTCTIIDTHGCSSTQSFTITQPTALSASSSATSILCNGGTSSVTVTASGGTPSYNGTGTFTATAGGPYTYNVTDANGCATSTTVTITQPTAISTSFTTVNELCNGASTGSIDLTVSGGTPGYTYNWNSGMYTTQDLTGIPAGTYSGTVTDANGCTNSGTVSITQPTAINSSVVQVNVSCNGLSDGSINLTVSGGTPGYTYNWNSGMFTTQDISGLPAGSYIDVITDANGCTNTGTVNITQPAVLTATVASATNPSTCGGSNGSVDITVTGGTAAYTYQWNNTAISQDIMNVAAATYSCSITDANGCTTTISQTLSDPNPPVVTLNVAQSTACVNDGPMNLAGSPPGGTYSGTGVTGSTFNPMTAGTGTFTITYNYTDPNTLCSGTATHTITVNQCTGISEQSLENGFSISPNPNNGEFSFTLNGTTSADVIIFDALGQVVNSFKATAGVKQQLEISATGMYTITIITADGQRSSQRVIVTK